jgi:hypothetical protein
MRGIVEVIENKGANLQGEDRWVAAGAEEDDSDTVPTGSGSWIGTFPMELNKGGRRGWRLRFTQHITAGYTYSSREF